MVTGSLLIAIGQTRLHYRHEGHIILQRDPSGKPISQNILTHDVLKLSAGRMFKSGCCFWHPLLAAPDYCHNWASKMTFCVWLSVCVRDPELVNLKWKRLFQGVLTPYCSAGSLRDLIKVIFWDVLSYCIRIIAPRISSFLVSNSASHRFSQVDSSVSVYLVPHLTFHTAASSSHQVFCLWFGLSETCCWSETLEGPMREELTSG